MIYILLQTRISSTRLPAKAMLSLEGIPIFELSARRLGNTGIPVVLCTSDDKSDDILTEYAQKRDMEVFRGSLTDVLERFSSFAQLVPKNSIIVRATADNVFPDGNFVQALINEFIENELGYLYANALESDLPDGLKVEIMKSSDLIEAAEKAFDQYSREHVTPYIINKYGAVHSLQWEGSGFGGLRATIDTLHDYFVVSKVFNRLEGDPFFVGSLELCRILKELNNEAYE